MSSDIRFIGDIKSGTAMCRNCMIKAGYKPKDNGFHTAVIAHCTGCDDAKPLLAMRHWVRQKLTKERVSMKTEIEIIDELGDWLCTDMEKDVVKSFDGMGLPPTSAMNQVVLIKDVARRIKWYRDNVISEGVKYE